MFKRRLMLPSTLDTAYEVVVCMALTVVISHEGRSKKLTVDDITPFLGKKIGDTIPGELLGLTGYTLRITGGSDQAGFPMRKDVDGPGRKKILAVGGVGIRKKKGKGVRQRKTVAGNTVWRETAALNLTVVEAGSQPLFEEPKEEAAEAASE